MNGLAVLPPTEEILTIRPGSLRGGLSAPSSGAKAWVAMTTAGDVDLHLLAEVLDRQVEQGAGHRDAGIVDQAGQGLAVQRAPRPAARRRARRPRR